jgi:Secretion system C-terminal sorting domain
MKKIYMVSCLMAMVLLFAGQTISAQTCSASRTTFHVKVSRLDGSTFNAVNIQGYPAGLPVNLFSLSAAPIFNISTTDVNGNASFSYPDGYVPSEVCVSAAFPADCCFGIVPPLAACPLTAPAIFPVRFNTTPTPICAIYTRLSATGETFALFDANGVLIPVTRNTSLDGGSPQPGALVCFTYDCSKTPTTFTVCLNNVGDGQSVGSNCCSRPLPPQAVLPVRLAGIAVSKVQGNIQLNWTTSLEIGSKSFVIEKSGNGTDFSSIGSVDASGNTYLKTGYSFIDNATTPGAAYYRLKMVDIDGGFEYSRVVYINNGKSGASITVGPNPFTDYIQLIGISSAEITRANVQIFNQTGQQVSYRVTGANAIALDETAPKGLYILKVKSQQFKIVRQ